ncbi:MAG: prepilin-type N-terminal cleavage/methylation domain-containing protein [Armatimonadetes bacterium]|nr:prepilin-type N-terminal cleavage/methylation domain-containing protein [Armatimonadota bacterium]
MRRTGFTLVEFVVVVAIIGITAAVLFPVFQRPTHHGYERRGRCRSNLKQIALGLKIYVQDYNDKFPPVAVARSGYWAGSIQPYIQSWQIFQCPTAPNQKPKTTDYFYNARLAQIEEKNLDFLPQIVLAGEGNDDSPTNYALSTLPEAWRHREKSPVRRHLDGANYAFADGHVKWLQPEKVSAKAPANGVYTLAIR